MMSILATSIAIMLTVIMLIMLTVIMLVFTITATIS
jgi:hypothetical protein